MAEIQPKQSEHRLDRSCAGAGWRGGPSYFAPCDELRDSHRLLVSEGIAGKRLKVGNRRQEPADVAVHLAVVAVGSPPEPILDGFHCVRETGPHSARELVVHGAAEPDGQGEALRAPHEADDRLELVDRVVATRVRPARQLAQEDGSGLVAASDDELQDGVEQTADVTTPGQLSSSDHFSIGNGPTPPDQGSGSGSVTIDAQFDGGFEDARFGAIGVESSDVPRSLDMTQSGHGGQERSDGKLSSAALTCGEP